MRVISLSVLLVIFAFSVFAQTQQFPSTEPLVPFPSNSKAIVGDPDFEKVIQFREGSNIWELGRGVAHLDINKEGACSGFLVEVDLLMTNEHCVVVDGQARQPSKIEVYMDYYMEGRKGQVNARGQEFIAINKQLDYALLLLDQPLGKQYPVLKLSGELPTDRGQVMVIQHPRGRSKEISRRNSEIVRVHKESNVIHYRADTEGGSSGSPVFSLDGAQVIALHHAGNSAGFNEGILMASILKDLGGTTGPSIPATRWEHYAKLVDNGIPIKINTNRDAYTIGQNMTMNVDIPDSGYLHLINISQQDEMILLFPNKYQRDNRVNAGQMAFPTTSMPFDLTAMEPTGKQLLVVLMTSEPLDLYAESEVAGKALFAPISSRSMSSMSRFTSRTGHYWAGKAETEIVR